MSLSKKISLVCIARKFGGIGEATLVGFGKCYVLEERFDEEEYNPIFSNNPRKNKHPSNIKKLRYYKSRI